MIIIPIKALNTSFLQGKKTTIIDIKKNLCPKISFNIHPAHT